MEVHIKVGRQYDGSIGELMIFEPNLLLLSFHDEIYKFAISLLTKSSARREESSILWHNPKRSFTTCKSHTHTLGVSRHPWIIFPSNNLLRKSSSSLFADKPLAESWIEAKAFVPRCSFLHRFCVAFCAFSLNMATWATCRDWSRHLCALLRKP